MSSMSAGGMRGAAAKPPEKGVFPLDHFGECTEAKQAYLKCLKDHGNESEPCRSLSKAYLECRMSRNLMAPQDLRELGFREEGANKKAEPPQQPAPTTAGQPTDEQQGYVAGLKRFKK